MDLSQQLTNLIGLRNQINLLEEQKEGVENEVEALFSSISSKLLQEEETNSFDEETPSKYNIQEGYNILNIENRFYSFLFDCELYRIYNLQEIQPIKID